MAGTGPNHVISITQRREALQGIGKKFFLELYTETVKLSLLLALPLGINDSNPHSILAWDIG